MTNGAGTCSITATRAEDANYNASAASVAATVTVNKANLMITANNTSRIYGAANPATPGFTAPGLVGTDAISSVTYTYQATATATAAAGTTHTITPSASVFGTGSAGNYTIIYANGTLAINPATLTVIADAKNKTYGAADPAFTYTASGFVNGDTNAILSGALIRIPGENVGTHAINQGSLSGGNNYNIAYSGANLTINPAMMAKPAWLAVSASSTNGTIFLSWKASSVPGAKYVVEESTDPSFAGGGTQVYYDSAISATLRGRTNGTDYYPMKTTAANYNDSAWTGGVNGCSVSVMAVNSAWLAVSLTSTDGTIFLSWNVSTTPAKFVVEESIDPTFAGGGDAGIQRSGYQCRFRDRTNGTYYYRLKTTAVNYNDSAWTGGNNGCSVSVKAAAPKWIAISATSTNGTIFLSWNATATLGSKYVVEESTDPTFAGGGTQVYNDLANSATLRDRTNGVYYYRVKATTVNYNDSVWSGGSNGCSVTVKAADPSWIAVSTTSTNGTIFVNWKASATNGALYVLEESTDPLFTSGGIQVYNDTATSTILRGRTSGTYYYRVKSTSTGYNDSLWTNSSGCIVSIN